MPVIGEHKHAQRNENIVLFLMLVVTWESVKQWMNINVNISWFVFFVCNATLLYMFYEYYHQEFKREVFRTPLFVGVFIMLIGINTLYGVVMIEDGYDGFCRLIQNVANWLMCLSVLYFQEPLNVSSTTARWCKVSLPLFFFLVGFMQGEAVGRYFAPFSFLIIFYPYMRRYWKRVLIIVLLLVFFYGALGARSVAIRFIVGGLLALVLSGRWLSIQKLKWLNVSLFLSPFVFFCLAVTTPFNIFHIQETMGWEDVEVQGAFSKDARENLGEDTRTFIYEEEISSAISNNYVLFGRSLARGYDSWFFSDSEGQTKGIERFSSEVRILNLFNYMGLIGIIIYMFISLLATINTFRKGNSYAMLIVGTYVMFRWAYAWIEDFDRFDLINLYIWIPIAMCYSPKFLAMKDSDFRHWVYCFFIR